MGAPDFSRIGDNHLTLTERVYRELRGSIATGAIAPGTRLTIVDLAQRMAVSRTPVAEALARLEQEGLVVGLPRLGFLVPVLSPEEARRLNEARLMCQLFAVKQALPTITDEQIEHIRAELGDYPNIGIDEAVRRRGSGIGHLLVSLIDNAVIRDWQDFAELKIQPYRLLFHEALTTEERKAVADEHNAVLDAIKARDWERIEALMLEHTRHHTELTLRSLERFFGSANADRRGR